MQFRWLITQPECQLGIPAKRQFGADPETADVNGNSASLSQAHGEQPESL